MHTVSFYLQALFDLCSKNWFILPEVNEEKSAGLTLIIFSLMVSQHWSTQTVLERLFFEIKMNQS